MAKSIVDDLIKGFLDDNEDVVVGLDKLPTGFVSTQSLSIDWVLGKGIPFGKIVEIFGDTSTGKSLLVFHILSEMQKKGGFSVYIDTESSFDPHFANIIGLDVDNNFLYLQINAIETIFDFIDYFCELFGKEKYTFPAAVIVWDSLAGTSTKKELENSVEKAEMAERARIIGKGIRKISKKLSDKNIGFVIVNQIRDNVGVMYGNPISTPGGKGTKFAASIRLELKHKKRIKDDNNKEKVIGILCQAESVKNRVVAPFRKAQFEVYFDKGIIKESGIMEVLEMADVVDNSRGWYQFKNSFDGLVDTEKKIREDEVISIMEQNNLWEKALNSNNVINKSEDIVSIDEDEEDTE
ncbi:DNA recombination/repair protein RecA [Candidatus Pacearchaeota archaeon]|jgi:recombination protein RecA|nr:DNA recombination/repair protein RecA [Candidatus Pacearchaeota archaeon]